MTTYNFDERIERRSTNSSKWTSYPEDVLPMFVADMDFRSPDPIVKAIQHRASLGHFGYAGDSPELREIICERMQRLYQWEVKPEEIIFMPGVVFALHMVNQTIGKPGDGILFQAPIYGPFFRSVYNSQRFAQTAELTYVQDDSATFHYEMDFDALEAAITEQTSLFTLCNPYNPTGFMYTKEQLEKIADICARHNVIICSDEIHSDLLLDTTARHISIASLSPEISQNTVTLLAPSKTFNLPGLKTSIAIVQNPELHQKIQQSVSSLGIAVNLLGISATIAAYSEGQEWLDQALAYLRSNRDFLVQYIRDNLSPIRTTIPQATYLAWLDCRLLNIEQEPYQYFLDEAKVALSEGTFFGSSGAGFVRLNFGCPRSMLKEGLDCLKYALEKI